MKYSFNPHLIMRLAVQISFIIKFYLYVTFRIIRTQSVRTNYAQTPMLDTEKGLFGVKQAKISPKKCQNINVYVTNMRDTTHSAITDAGIQTINARRARQALDHGRWWCAIEERQLKGVRAGVAIAEHLHRRPCLAMQ